MRRRPLVALPRWARSRHEPVPRDRRDHRGRRPVAALTAMSVGLGLLAAGLVAAPAQAALTDGLVLRYKLDETTGTTAADSSGNGRNGTVNGTATWGGGQGLALDGSTGYVRLPNDVMSGLTSISVATDLWIDAAQATPYFIFGLGNTSGSNGNGYLFATGNAYRASIATGNWSTEQTTGTSSNLARGGWKHIAYTQTGNTAVLYEDGVEVARNTAVTITPGAIGSGTTTANYLGRSNYTGDRLLKGKVRDFRIYDRALGAAEVAELATTAVSESLPAEAAALSLGDTSAVTSNLSLPATGSLGAKITWTSGAPAVISSSGVVTRPANGSGDATVTLQATLARGARTATRSFTVTVPERPDDAAAARAAAAALVVRNIDDVRGNLTLPSTGTGGSSVGWISSNPAVVSATGEVNRPAPGEPTRTVTLTANVVLGTGTATREFTATVPALPAPAPKTGYVFSYFTGEGTSTGEQMYFALSKGNDPLKWRELNGGKPVLTSTLGEKGIRDPFITRSPEGDKFYLIATDLKINGGNGWDASQRTGSKSLAVWESTDLVTWGDMRLVKVSPDTAGNTWAPEAFWDKSIGAYVVYWASKLYAADDPNHTGSTYNRMMYATTRDFWTFSEPKVWKDPGYSVIDSTVTEHEGTFYRFTKDERNNSSSTPCSKYIIAEKSTSLRSTNWDFVSECIGAGDLGAGEGPTVFKSNTENKWYLFIDEYGGRGYVPFSSTDLSTGKWTVEPSYSLPTSPRHGTVTGVTRAEYLRLLSAYSGAQTVASVKDTAVDTIAGTAPVLPATVTATYGDGSTGSVAVTWDDVPAADYASPGTFTVLGTVTDGSVRAKAVVTVAEKVEGLELRYSFDEGSGTVAKDTSGHGRDGTYVNSPAFGAGVRNGALVLSGGAGSSTTAPYVTIPNGVLKGLDDVTVSSWVKWTSSTSGFQWLFGLGSNSSRYLFMSPNYQSSALRAAITTGSWSTEQAVSSSALPAGSWQHVAVTINSATRTAVLYVNGSPVATNTSVTLKASDLYDAAASSSGYIGKSLYSSDPYLGAAVDDFRIYSKALSADDVAVLAGNTAAIRSASVAGQKITPLVHEASSTVTLPMKPGSDLTALAPELTLSKGATVSPASGSTHDFTSPVTYTVTGADGTVRAWTVKAAELRTPVLPGLYADPNIAVFGDTYWIYPTTDGFAGWSGTRFHAFSSKDLVNWTDHGVILDLGPDVSWADSYAWAPTISEKDGKYYFYFCAEQSIGVAVADSPAGPFKDALGKPLVAKGSFSGQMIDPQVFTDDDGSHYLYWGNGSAYAVKLNPDMVSFNSSAVQNITPANYNEGAFVFKRKGIYYFSWSENDTRDENYQVAYAYGTSPFGPFNRQGVILSKDLSQGIKGTGHHSVVQVPGTDDWYVAYHRFALPDGDGTHRETTIDRLRFTAKNLVEPVVPTLGGVTAAPVPDRTAPTVSATVSPTAPTSGWYTGPATVTVTGKDDRDAAVTLDASVSGPDGTGGWGRLTGPLALRADGRHEVRYRATDGSGNVSEVGSVTVRIDTTAPVSKAITDPAARTVTLTAADATSGVARTEYSTDGGTTWRTYGAPVTVGRTAATVAYRAVDTAGNTEATNTVTVPTSLRPSTTTATVSPGTVAVGGTVTVKAKVTGPAGAPVPTGKVRVFSGSVQLGIGVLSGGRVSIPVGDGLQVGKTPLTVLYGGDARYDSSGTRVALTVTKATSRTTLGLSASGVAPGRSVTATATVTSATGVPVTGTVKVTVSGGGVDRTWSGTVNASGKVVVTIGPFPRTGTVSVTATYGGSDTVAGSTSATATLRVRK